MPNVEYKMGKYLAEKKKVFHYFKKLKQDIIDLLEM